MHRSARHNNGFWSRWWRGRISKRLAKTLNLNESQIANLNVLITQISTIRAAKHDRTFDSIADFFSPDGVNGQQLVDLLDKYLSSVQSRAQNAALGIAVFFNSLNQSQRIIAIELLHRRRYWHR